MAINSCSINAFTINSARCRRPNLFPPNPPAVTVFGTNNSSVAVDFAKRYPHLVRHTEHELDDHPPLQFEQPFITVTAEFMGQTGTHTLEAKPHLEFVSVVDLKISEPSPDITVNISDFSI